MLTSEQLKEYAVNGFTTINDVFSDLETQEMLDAFQCEPIQKHFKKNPDGFGFHFLEITTLHSSFLKYACHPKIVSLIQPILGKDIELQHSKSTVKMPGSAKGIINWHQDFAYLPHTNTSLLTVMIALVDFTRENGCMRAVKGSHQLGILNHRDSEGNQNEQGCSEDWAWQPPYEMIHLTPKKGGLSIHHGLTLHSSGNNFSALPRYSLAFTYRASDAYQIGDKVWKDTGLLVSGNNSACVNVRLEPMKIPMIRNANRYPECPFGSAFTFKGEAVRKGLTSPFLD